MTRPMTVLYVAAEEDEPLRKKLETHLALLEQQGKMRGWHAQQILAGSVLEQHKTLFFCFSCMKIIVTNHVGGAFAVVGLMGMIKGKPIIAHLSMYVSQIA